MSFEVDSKSAFEIPLQDVSSAATGIDSMFCRDFIIYLYNNQGFYIFIPFSFRKKTQCAQNAIFCNMHVC